MEGLFYKYDGHGKKYVLFKKKGDKKPTTIQTLIFDKDVFKTVGSAKAWLKKHGFTSHKVDENENSFRFRQIDPGKFKKDSFRTIELKKGVKAVIGKLK